MRIKFRFETYESKVATLVSILQSGIVGIICLWIVFNIPSFIVLLCGVTGYVVGILFGVLSLASLVAWFCLIRFVDASKVNNYFFNKHGSPKTERVSISSILPETRAYLVSNYFDAVSELAGSLNAQEQLQSVKGLIQEDMTAYLISEEIRHAPSFFYFGETDSAKSLRSLAGQHCLFIALYYLYGASELEIEKERAINLIGIIYFQETKKKRSFFEATSFIESKLAFFNEIKEKNKIS